MRKYKYDGKEYDFDAYKQQAIKNFDSWAAERNLGKTRTEKIRQATLELLQHMGDDEKSTADLQYIHFGTDYANNKGIFGKDVKDSKHYKNATAYLLDQFNSSSPYEEPKPAEKSKTKLSAKIIGQDILDRLGDVSTLNDEFKRKAQSDAWNYVLNKYKWDSPDLYELEGPHTLQELNTFLTEGINSFNTTDLNDDNYYYSRFGINSPFYKNPVDTQPKQLTILDQAKQQWIQNGFSEEEWNEVLPSVKKMLKAGLLKQLGINNIELVDQEPVKVSSSDQNSPTQTSSASSPQSTNSFDYSYYGAVAKPWILKNRNNVNDPKWQEIDSYMSKLVESQLKGEQNNYTKPSLKQITYDGKKYWWVSSIDFGDKQYVYDPEDKQMGLIPKKIPYVIYRKEKGGYLQTLKNTNYYA